MADIRINELPIATGVTSPSPSDNIAIDGLTTRKTPLSALGDVTVPVATQAEAEAGTNPSKRMTPLTTAQAITALGATAAQGAKADTALQPGQAATLSQGSKADSALQPSLIGAANGIAPLGSNSRLAIANLPVNVVGGYTNSVVNANNLLEAGWAVGNNATGAPTNTGDGDWYQYENIGAGDWVVQYAYSFFVDATYKRYRRSGAWGAWQRDYQGDEKAPQVQAGSSRYPTGPAGSGTYRRVDGSSQVAGNTISGKTGQFGKAAVDGLTWVESILPGTDQPGVVSVYSISDSGNYAGVFGVRSSDNAQPTAQNIIAHIAVAQHDNPSVGHNVWGRYVHGWWSPGSSSSGFLLNEESSIYNGGSDGPLVTPYDLILGSTNAGQRVNLRLTAGTGLIFSNKVSTALQITNNNGQFVSGIVFGAGALSTASGYADAISFPQDIGLSFYKNSSASRAWRMFCNDTAAADGEASIILGDRKMQITKANVNLDSGRVLGLNTDGTIGFRFNSGNGHVELLRPDGTVVAFWVV